LSRLSVFLIEQDIDLIFGWICHPQTQGKVECFHRTLARSMIKQGLPTLWKHWQSRYDGFLGYYNYVRPHEVLGMQKPAQCYQRSARNYQSQTALWQYPRMLAVVRVDVNGMTRWDGGCHFVCEAQVHQQVALDQIGGEPLMRFRNMFIRQIDLATHRPSPFMHPASDLL